MCTKRYDKIACCDLIIVAHNTENWTKTHRKRYTYKNIQQSSLWTAPTAKDTFIWRHWQRRGILPPFSRIIHHRALYVCLCIHICMCSIQRDALYVVIQRYCYWYYSCVRYYTQTCKKKARKQQQFVIFHSELRQE